jgi:hypothetical protein
MILGVRTSTASVCPGRDWERADVRHILIALAALAASVFVLANAAHGF